MRARDLTDWELRVNANAMGIPTDGKTREELEARMEAWPEDPYRPAVSFVVRLFLALAMAFAGIAALAWLWRG